MTKTIGKYILKVEQDPDPINPREYSTLTTMICFHRRYDLGDKTSYRSGDYNNWKELKEDIEKREDPFIIYPLYLYDHSGITISTSPFSDPWDSGQIGFIFMTKTTLEENSTDAIKADEWVKEEVKEYDSYLRGEVYRYSIIDSETEEVVEQVGGYFSEEVCEKEAIGVMKYIKDQKN
jgi:hypothetical protein